MLFLQRVLPIPLLALLAAASIPENYTCPHHLYNIQVFSQDPLIIYIPSFITETEAQHLQEISLGKFQSSQIADRSGKEQKAFTRTSRSTSLATDSVIRCIEERALAFQGYETQREQLEPLQIVEYEMGQNYRPHTDWFTSPSQTTAEFGGNRISSFFVYVGTSESIIGGGTQFPFLDAPKDERWCGVVNCDAPWEEGVTFRPIARNAVFWRNMKAGTDSKLEGDRRTLHAGLPVQRGWKLGMNVWTREGELNAKYRSDNIE
ncbi:uncharacterized protein BDR25DRAFT_22167 [Lindgomyces ingoldianus]|uniref:Uncharacterized protein n=1 Tax=Lindgomyces ingoldianus TaxID=673940 RepID=A0ACB6QXB5_9PLEO|nr:uncharacterized protein BDR25DRAFT_22167 [Lindgomyces ingoldianus]KAF2471663.1 hypothetical protein BDR25DRAFT_22167 [Lindgomyces ingoldianus]